MNEAEKLFLDALGITEEKIKEQMRREVVQQWTTAYILYLMSKDKDASLLILEQLRGKSRATIDTAEEPVLYEDKETHIRMLNEVYNSLAEFIVSM